MVLQILFCRLQCGSGTKPSFFFHNGNLFFFEDIHNGNQSIIFPCEKVLLVVY